MFTYDSPDTAILDHYEGFPPPYAFYDDLTRSWNWDRCVRTHYAHYERSQEGTSPSPLHIALQASLNAIQYLYRNRESTPELVDPVRQNDVFTDIDQSEHYLLAIQDKLLAVVGIVITEDTFLPRTVKQINSARSFVHFVQNQLRPETRHEFGTYQTNKSLEQLGAPRIG